VEWWEEEVLFKAKAMNAVDAGRERTTPGGSEEGGKGREGGWKHLFADFPPPSGRVGPRCDFCLGANYVLRWWAWR
jgi:hypothetical protein